MSAHSVFSKYKRGNFPAHEAVWLKNSHFWAHHKSDTAQTIHFATYNFHDTAEFEDSC